MRNKIYYNGTNSRWKKIRILALSNTYDLNLIFHK